MHESVKRTMHYVFGKSHDVPGLLETVLIIHLVQYSPMFFPIFLYCCQVNFYITSIITLLSYFKIGNYSPHGGIDTNRLNLILTLF